MERISAVYKIMNEVTGDSYIGSSKDVKRRWKEHKRLSTWKNKPNKPLYQDMQKYGVDKFRFQILCPVEPEYLTQVEQEYIEMLKPTYNNNNAKGQNAEKRKEVNRKASRKYYQSEKGKEAKKKYYQKVKETKKKYYQKVKEAKKKYYNQLCEYNCETLTLCALISRFQKAGIPHPTLEAKKYLINEGLIQC